jgi:hypothetical protein
MYLINILTCRAADVIERSAVCHPTLVASELRDMGRLHADYAGLSRDSVAAASAARASADCYAIADRIAADELEIAALSFGERIQAFSVAARLQCIPRLIQTEIIGRA